MAAHSVHYNSIVWQGVIQDFEVEGGNKKSSQKILKKKKGQLFQYPDSM